MTFKAERPVVTDGAAAPGMFTFKIKGTENIAAGQYVTATATRTDTDETSELSQPVKVKRR